MYLKHFGLKQYPFAKDIAPDELFPSSSLQELQTRLSHAIELRGIALVTGDSGSGKTTACRKVARGLHDGLYKILYVPNSTGNVMDLYKAICWVLGLETLRSRAALYRAICGEVTRLMTDSRITPLLIIDEAHHLRSDVLEDLRLLTNYEMDSQNRLCLILVGQTELRRRVSMSVHEALSQRIVMRYQVEGMAFLEMEAYLKHLVPRAGTSIPLFEPAAVHAVYQATSGLPRKVNLLCHHVLMATALARAQTATIEHVQSALEDIK